MELKFTQITQTEAVLVGAILTLFAALLTAFVTWLRDRSEKQRWSRTLELEREKWERQAQLEQQRFDHERQRWTIELNSQREAELHKLRLQTYPKLFELLSSLAVYSRDGLTAEQIGALADSFNEFGYNAAGLAMLSETRDTLFSVRDLCRAFASGTASMKELHRARTDLIEFLRRDCSHDRSVWRDSKSLLEINREDMERRLYGARTNDE